MARVRRRKQRGLGSRRGRNIVFNAIKTAITKGMTPMWARGKGAGGKRAGTILYVKRGKGCRAGILPFMNAPIGILGHDIRRRQQRDRDRMARHFLKRVNMLRNLSTQRAKGHRGGILPL